ncbi:lariat debranching enzyme [Coprinopsis cinerea AmutBmut pab1-1]|nr:lariat debranching enzyme [Coprinopsis cinerea AmutBmut pab1-1]
MYFLGHAGSVLVDGLRVSGISGIFKGHDFGTGHPERLPYDQSSMRSIYHTREFDIRRLSLLPSPDVFVSHDWPQNIAYHGDLRGLLRRKRFFEADIKSGRLGSPPLMGLLQTLQPKWWFAAHLHVRFEASVVHETAPAEDPSNAQNPAHVPVSSSNPDEIAIEDDDDEGDEAEVAASIAPPSAPSNNPDEIVMADADADAVEQPSAPPLPPQARAKANPDEIMLDDEEEDVAPAPVAVPAAPHPPAPTSNLPPRIIRETKFLALDKCLPKRQFLEVIEIDVPSTSSLSTSSSQAASSSSQPEQSPSQPSSSMDTTSTSPPQRRTPTLAFDPEWLAITRAFHPWFNTTSKLQRGFPGEEEARAMVAKEREWVEVNLIKASGGGGESSDSIPSAGGAVSGSVKHEQRLLKVEDVQVFEKTAPGPCAETEGANRNRQPPHYPNPQTVAFCKMLGIEDKVNMGR